MSLVINAIDHGTVFIEAKYGPYHPWDKDEIWKGEGSGLLKSIYVAVSLIRDGLPGIPVLDYVDENVSTIVVRIIQSYVGVVNKMVWRKFRR